MQKKIVCILSLTFYLWLNINHAIANVGRKTIPLNDNWSFYFAYNFEKNIQKESISVPHTWNAQETLKGIAAYNRTAAIYERSLDIPAYWQGKRLFLFFEGVNSVASIFVNNKFVSEHKGGYTAFSMEVTNYVKPGKNNLTVQVSNAYRLDVLPLHGDFNIYGGIHRPVSLIVTEQNCISPLDYASSGVYLTQNVNEKQAQIEVLTKLSIQNATKLKLRTSIFDKDKREIVSTIDEINDKPTALTQKYSINNPILWNGKSNPYLYTVEVSLLENGVPIDKVSQPLGLRYFHVDPENGFFLNGRYLNLYGVGRHEDVAGKGSALQHTDHERDMNLIQEIGATAARLTHYPQNSYFYDLADQKGIVLWSEIPFVGPGGYTGTGFVNNENLKNQARENLIELIRQNYNHPAIFFWGIFNELKLNYDDPEPFLKELHNLAKKEDPNRLTTLASNLGDDKFTTLTDLMGWNQYFGWYGNRFSEVADWADKTHRNLPNKPISISEYGAGASPFKHTEELKQPIPSGKFHPEEWQTAFHEAHWKLLKERSFLWGKFIWVLADFGSSIRTEGDQNGINDKGLVTYDRSTKKDAFYFYKANWNPEPMIYIAERRNNVRHNATTSIKVYANTKEVELWVNGIKQEKKAKNDINIVKWDNVKLTQGRNIIIAKTKVNGKIIKDSCEWQLQPAQTENN
ncbi:glycoside hydrolase family 2 TIM barrel-domain containing protein [Pedobacter sp. ASV28]|uniref:glycoside hydrolase family 2 protein n=1 Tax=Pedobacter sp. ASV28 TaxID=2795123 RepID=UPI0018EE44CF|nr:glycoside hydrolase family 2 TIM barrel-domain containing protein [Pedobacter sp. ASV28]